MVLASLLGAGCEAQTTVVTEIEFPPEVAPSDRAPDRLHVQVKESSSFSQKLDVPDGKCPAFDAAVKSADARTLKATTYGFETTQSRIPSVPEFCAAAWYDTNASGKIDAGDAVGSFSVPYPCQPSTFLGSNQYESPAVVLEIVR
jgi:hypothetical protein